MKSHGSHRRRRPWPDGLRRTPGVVALTLLVSVAAVSGCFSEHASVTGPPEELTCEDVPPDGRTGDNPVVVIRNFAFHPEELSVDAGTTVTWINCEDAGGPAHTSTSDTGAWDSGLLGSNGADVFRRAFQQGGTFDYHCTPHPFMQGTVRVGS